MSDCFFEYPSRWQQLYQAFLGQDENQLRQAIAQLDERDVALEDHLRNRPCGGSDPVWARVDYNGSQTIPSGTITTSEWGNLWESEDGAFTVNWGFGTVTPNIPGAYMFWSAVQVAPDVSITDPWKLITFNGSGNFASTQTIYSTETISMTVGPTMEVTGEPAGPLDSPIKTMVRQATGLDATMQYAAMFILRAGDADLVYSGAPAG